jgi:hypothetical protein
MKKKKQVFLKKLPLKKKFNKWCVSSDGISWRLQDHLKTVFWNCLTSGMKQFPFLIASKSARSVLSQNREWKWVQENDQVGQECGIFKSSDLRDLRALRFHPYEVCHWSRSWILQFQLHTYTFFCWKLQCVHDDIVNPTLLLMSNKTWLHLSGFINAQNTHHWDTENPLIIYDVPSCDYRVGVWCAISDQRVTGTVTFYDMVNSSVT